MKKEKLQYYEVYNHYILWNTALKNLSLATPESKDAKFYALGTMLLSFFAFEGYLNWLGSKIAYDVWNEEKQFFSREPFIGTLGKYRFLAMLLRLPSPNAASSFFQTATLLSELRDSAVHPKPEFGSRIVKFSGNHYPPHYQGSLEKAVSPELAVRAKEHLEALAEELHREACAAYPGVINSTNAFGPLYGYEITDA